MIVQRAGDVIPQVVGPGRRAPARHGRLEDAVPLPALRRRGRQARGRGQAPLPQPRLPVARARDAHPLGQRRDGHRGRRRAVRPQALGRGTAAVDARPLPAHGGAAARGRGLRRDLGDARDRRDRAVEAAAVLARPVRPQHAQGRLGAGAQPSPAFRRRRRADGRDAGGARGGRGDRARPRRADRRVVLRRGEPRPRRRPPRRSGCSSRSGRPIGRSKDR